MKVLHIIMSFNTGGAENLIVDLVNNSNITHQNVAIINKSYDINLINKLDDFENVKLINRPEGSRNALYFLKIIRLVTKIKPDIVHCHNIASLKIGIIIKQVFRKIKLVYTVHDTNIIRNNIKLVSNMNKYCDRIIAISNSVKDECLRCSIDNNKIEMIYNGIDLKKFNINKRKHRGVNIGCIARLYPEKKGQDILIKAINEIHNKYDINLLFAGDVISIKGRKKTEDLEKLKKLARKLGIESKVTFCGNVKNIPEFLSNIDILVLPSRYEGFGLVLLEAMAAKIPVIATDIDGPRMIIKKDYGYLFNKEDYEDLALKIVECIENYKKTIDIAYQYVCDNYSIETMCNGYNLAYERVLKGRG